MIRGREKKKEKKGERGERDQPLRQHEARPRLYHGSVLRNQRTLMKIASGGSVVVVRLRVAALT
jgi:hypothetical protein